MMWVMLTLLCAAMAASYPTANPISEPQNSQLAMPDEADNIDTPGDDCELDNTSPVATKKNEEENEPVARRQCSSRVYVRLGRQSAVGSESELNSPEEEDTALTRLGRGGRSNYNFVRFGRGGRNDNFVRFGRGSKQGNFIRFGRGRSDNFVRLGRKKASNFIRFGRGTSENFIRFGRGKHENFIRFGRDKQGNFIRFGREMKNSNDHDEILSLEDTDENPEDIFFANSNLGAGRGEKSEGNFIRFGRGRPSNFIRLGRGDDRTQPEERGKENSKIVRSGRQPYDDNFVRLGRSPGYSDAMRRGKLTDRNFIRLGRSGQEALQYDDTIQWENSEMLGRSDRPVNNHNLIRLGKRAQDGDIDGQQVLDTPPFTFGDAGNKTVKHVRNRRYATLSGDDEIPAESADYPTITPHSAYDDGKISSTFEDSQILFRYYSPLASGIPNYILGPELPIVAALSNAVETKGGKGGGHDRNYIRLG
jgi:hypothetical protein